MKTAMRLTACGMGRGGLVAAVLVAAAMGGIAPQALGQSSRDRQQMAASGRVLERVRPSDWTLRVTVNLRAFQDIDPNTHMPRTSVFDFTSASVVFPMLVDTAASQTRSPGGPPSQSSLGGELSLNDRVVEKNTTFLSSDYPSGTRLGRWGVPKEWTGQEVQLRVTIPATCWQTLYNEEAAKKIGWPQQWPPVAQSTFKPQLFVDLMPDQNGQMAESDMKEVEDLIQRWTNGKDPKSLPPAELAKFLAGQVWGHVQVSGDGANFARTGEMEGLDLQGAAETARRRRGTEFDMVCLLAAVYRKAGLPCRTVIGYDVGESKRDEKDLFAKKRGSKGLRAWVEFALVDPDSGRELWVPVDVVRMRKNSTRPPSLDRPWKYFGEHDELDGIIPFAFQFHPPTTVVAHGSPAFWGWMVTPRPPDKVIQVVRFDAITTPKTAEDQRREREAERKGRGR